MTSIFDFISRRPRVLSLAGITYLAMGALLLGLGPILAKTSPDLEFFSRLFGITASILGLAVGAIGYLRGDYAKEDETFPESRYASTREIERLADRFRLLEKKVLQSVPGRKDANADDLNLSEFLDSVRKDALANLPKDVSTELEKKFATKARDLELVNQIRSEVAGIGARLVQQISWATRRSNLNLVIGGFTTIIAAAFLGGMAFQEHPPFDTVVALLSHYVPRVSTIIFIEVFAFFFLRLYKSGIQDIRYFQNELTNIELKAAAIEATFLQTPTKSMETIIPELVRTDRNPSPIVDLKKDEGGSLDLGKLTELLNAAAKLSGK